MAGRLPTPTKCRFISYPAVFTFVLTTLETVSSNPCAFGQVVLKVRGLRVIIGVPITPMDKRREIKILREFGARVRRIRLQKGISQEALALTCDLDRSYIGSVERGERNISLLNIHKIARALGVSARELFRA